MQVLKLLVRVVVICNICFLAAAGILWLPNPPDGTVVSTVIVMGCLMGLPLNVVVLTWALILACTGRWQRTALKVWSLVFNFVVLCLNLLFILAGTIH